MNPFIDKVMSCLALVVLCGAPAAAQEQAQPVSHLGDELAWTRGVSEGEQRIARKLFEEGNSLLKDSLFAEAEAKYLEALAHWDHPAIHYNLALAIPSTIRPTEVWDHMRASMRFGDAPLGAERLKYGRAVTERMKREHAWVEVSCDCESTAALTSGQWLVHRADGHFEGFVPPGSHTLVATQKGYAPTDTTLTLKAGERQNLHLGRMRPSAVWKPWALVAAGAGVAVGGTFLHSQGRRDIHAFDAGIRACGGCQAAPVLLNQRSRGDLMQRIAVGSYVVGGAAVVTGLILAYTNGYQSRILPADPGTASVVVAPMLDEQHDGILATLRF